MTAALCSASAACAILVGIEDPDVQQQRTNQGQPDTGTSSSPNDNDADANASKPDVFTPGSDSGGAVKKRVFVTSDFVQGDLNGLAGADARCIAAANRASLLGNDWKAWLSANGANAIDRIKHDGPYVRLDSVQVVKDKAQLISGTLTAPINVDEERRVVSDANADNARVWTGSFTNGQLSVDCNNWSTTNALAFGGLGQLNRSDGSWTDNGGPGAGFRHWGCQTRGHLYCFEQ